MNILYLGTPEFAVPPLNKLANNHNIVLVVTQPDRANKRGNKVTYNAVKKYSIENNLEVFQPEDINSEESISYISKFNIDYIVVVAYGQIIKEEIRKLAKKNIVNIHASLLPKYRGAAPIHRAIMNRDDYTGISIMKVEKSLDTGEVYLKKEILIGNKKTPELHDDLSKLGSELILEYINLDSENPIKGKKQNDDLASYANKVSKDDGRLDFKDINIEIGKIYGLYPRPGASFQYKDQIVKVLNGRIYSKIRDDNYKNGIILDVNNEGIFVNCGNGILLIDEIQFPSKKPIDVKSYIKGNNIDKYIELR